jgi:hypothetical protein
LRHRRVGVSDVGARCLSPESNIVGNGEFVIKTRSMRQQSDSMTHRASVIPKVDSQDNCLTSGDRHESGKRPQERRLPRAIRSAQEHDASAVDIKIDTGKGRESAKQGHRPAEVDHGLRPGPESGVIGLHGVP